MLTEAETLPLLEQGELPPGRMRLLVMVQGKVSTHLLPSSGIVSIGRSKDSALQIEDPSVSRHHALLHVGVPLRLEDLGSANGTHLRGRRLGSREMVPLYSGEAIQLGPTGGPLLVIEGRTDAARSRAGKSQPMSGEEAMLMLQQLVERVAPSNLSVLILGETGVGKGMIAAQIHQQSRRASLPFLKLNCAAFPETLLEAELFGYHRGAFTGAVQSKPGLFEAADRGTIFLDEIGDLPTGIQAKLLHVLEDREILPLGAVKARPIDVRFISASNHDLESAVEHGRFRRDLYFRLNGISLRVPPLRQRLGEVERLSRAFVQETAKAAGITPEPMLSRKALEILKGHSWPGNVRELRNIIERAVTISGGSTIGPQHLPVEQMDALPITASADAERQRIIDALGRAGGNQSLAAKQLKISRRTLISRMVEYGIPRPRKSYKL
jgi:transcriptional regulator with PAS, ATPase and Fis domain